MIFEDSLVLCRCYSEPLKPKLRARRNVLRVQLRLEAPDEAGAAKGKLEPRLQMRLK